MPYITHCPVCQCQITVKGNIIKSHDTYIECLEALITELTYTLKRILAVMKLEISKRDELQKQLQKVYEIE